MFVYVVIEISWFSVFVKIIFGFSNIYGCFIEVIATFYSLSVSGTVIGGYPNIVLIISIWTFFFNKKIAYMLFVFTFMASASNSIMKSAMCFLSYQNIFIFYLMSATLLLLLNAVLISDKFIPILYIFFVFYLIDFLLYIDFCNTSSKLG